MLLKLTQLKLNKKDNKEFNKCMQGWGAKPQGAACFRTFGAGAAPTKNTGAVAAKIMRRSWISSWKIKSIRKLLRGV